jgi:elongation factor G
MSNARKPERPILTVLFSLSGTQIEARGMDEVRLEEFCRAICRDHGEAYDGQPKVILLEALRATAEGEGKYIRQTGGSGNYGHLKLRLEPGPQGEGFEFFNEVPESVLPGEYVAAAETGIRETTLDGVLFGHEIADAKATLFDGSYHETDSNLMAYQIAGAMAFKDAARKANPVLIEPLMAIETVIPETQYGELLQEINARHGRIEAVEWNSNSAAFRALVPMREALRSSPRGMLSYPMQFARYEPVLNPESQFGGDVLGAGVRNPKTPSLRSAGAAEELSFELE